MRATYLDHMGSDLTVVNAARVSFNKKSEGVWVKNEHQTTDGWHDRGISTFTLTVLNFSTTPRTLFILFILGGVVARTVLALINMEPAAIIYRTCPSLIREDGKMIRPVVPGDPLGASPIMVGPRRSRIVVGVETSANLHLAAVD